MNRAYAELMTFAVWLSPDDPVASFMWLVVAACALALLAAIAAVIVLQLTVERARELRLVTDVQDDPAMLGDYVELPDWLSNVHPITPELALRREAGGGRSVALSRSSAGRPVRSRGRKL